MREFREAERDKDAAREAGTAGDGAELLDLHGQATRRHLPVRSHGLCGMHEAAQSR